jgi:thiol-disulfide isomerase/thioredoxin
MRAILAAVLPALLSLSFPQGGIAGQEISISVGTEAPAAALEDLDGNPVQILDFIGEGKPTVLEFWAVWCPTCRALQPEMDRVQSTFGDRVRVVAVAVAVSQTRAQIKGHIAEHGIGYPFLWDGGGEAVRNFGIPGTGVVLILDGEGRVAYSGTGPDQRLVEALEKLLGN